MTGLAIGLAFLSGFGLGFAALVVWAGVAVVLQLRHQSAPTILAVILMAAVAGALLAREQGTRPLSTPPSGGFEGEIRVVDGPFLTQNGLRFTAELPELENVSVCAYAGSAPQPGSGDRVLAIGQITLLQDLSEVGRLSAIARGCTAQLRVGSLAVLEHGHGARATLARVRVELSQFLMSSAPGDTGALLSGLVTGDDGGLSTRASEAFLSSGTTHITAISGANLAMITLLLGVLASGSMRRSLAFVCAASVVIWLYVFMVGMQPSALRAALLASAVLLGRWLGRVPDLLTLTVLLAAVQIVFRPHDFETLAFRLSLAATIALIVVFDGRDRSGAHSWMSSLALSVIAAQLATLPILAMRIGEISGIGLLANLIIGPLAALAFPLALGGALVGQFNSLLGDASLTPAILIARTMVNIVTWSQEHLPGRLQLGEPTPAATTVLTATTWTLIFWMSGDVQRFARHALRRARDW